MTSPLGAAQLEKGAFEPFCKKLLFKNRSVFGVPTALLAFSCKICGCCSLVQHQTHAGDGRASGHARVGDEANPRVQRPKRGFAFAILRPAGVAVSLDGKIFLGVNAVDAQGGTDFAVARLNANGSFDTTFDGDGVAQADFNFSRDLLTGIALQPNGKIIAVGQVEVDQSGRYIHTGIARFDQNGSLDTSFGINGKKTTVEDGFQLYDVLDRAKAVALAPDGKIVVAGDYESRVGQRDVMVLRILGTPVANEVLFTNGFEG